MYPSNLSAMPADLDKQIGIQQVADLLTYISGGDSNRANPFCAGASHGNYGAERAGTSSSNRDRDPGEPVVLIEDVRRARPNSGFQISKQ